MSNKNVRELLSRSRDMLEILKELNGFYECPKDSRGKRCGTLVGYAGTYIDKDSTEKHYVGDVYANFAKAEEYPVVMWEFTKQLFNKFEIVENAVIVGPQMGGISVAQFLAWHFSDWQVRYACAEKLVVRAKSKNEREKSEIVFDRHSLYPKDQVIIAEDVLSNFSTTAKIISLIENMGARVIRIVSLLNRSKSIDRYYNYKGRTIPVTALVRKPFEQYRQDDPCVRDDIAQGNVVWKPKHEWYKIEQVMT